MLIQVPATGIGSTYFEVSNYFISRTGYSFRKGDVFKPVGLVTAKGLTSPISEFKFTVLETFSDNFRFMAVWRTRLYRFYQKLSRWN